MILLAFSLLDTLSFSFLHLALKKTELFILTANTLQTIFIITELFFIVYFYFISSKLLNLKKRFFLVSILTIISIVLIIDYNILRFKSFSLTILVFEVIFVNFFSSVFFVKNIDYELQNIPRHIKIINQSLFIFINFTAPYYFISSILNHDRSPITITLNFINDFGYSFLFFQFIKAFKCLQVKKS
jgi:hypothetical protein